jgi:hypothetical protein
MDELESKDDELELKSGVDDEPQSKVGGLDSGVGADS